MISKFNIVYSVNSSHRGSFKTSWVKTFNDFDRSFDRSQCVRYHNVLSDWQNLSGGVPQGTLNGPIIFMVLANDAARMKDPNKLALKYDDD